MAGAGVNGFNLGGNILVYYDPAPYRLTRSQVARTFWYSLGPVVAGIRPPPGEGKHYIEEDLTQQYRPCLSPYDVPPDMPAPLSYEQSHEISQAARDASKGRDTKTVMAPWVTASHWAVTGERFVVKADLSEVMDEHGPGVYTVVVWGRPERKRA